MSNKTKKKIVLVALNAKYIHSNPGIYSLQSYSLRKNPGAGVDTAVFTINQDAGKIVEEIYTMDPGLIGFSCYIWNIAMIRTIVGNLSRILPDTEIWLGGPEVSYCAEEILAELPVYGVMIGEGEETFAGLVREYYSLDKDYRRVKGIVTRAFHTGDPDVCGMDELPFVYHDLNRGDFENHILYYESSRGCPYSCTYCLSSIDKQVRFKSLDKVFEELQFFLDHGVRQVKFLDRTFNCRDSRAIAIWRYLSEHDNQITNFHFEIAAETLSEEALDLLAGMRPGLVRLEIGIQSTDLDTLKRIRRVMDPDQCRHVMEKLRKNGNIRLHLDLIAGLPGESYERFIRSFNEVYLMRPHELQLGFLKVLKGTAIEKEARDAGIVYGAEPPYEVLYTADLSYAQLRKLKAVEEMLESYYNSNQFERSIGFLEQYFETPYELYEALAEFYRENNYTVAQPSRIKRYEILLAFWKQCCPESKVSAQYDPEDAEKLLKECLLYDLYARECLKKRPDFAGDVPARIRKRESRLRAEDLHVEHFEILTGAPADLQFDYKDRDPVSGNAKVREEEKDEKENGRDLTDPG